MITDISKLVGKVIKKAQFLEYKDRLALTLSDGDICIIESHNNYGDIEIQLSDLITECDKFALGIITESEYSSYVIYNKIKSRKQQEQNDLAEYNRLKEKFGL